MATPSLPGQFRGACAVFLVSGEPRMEAQPPLKTGGRLVIGSSRTEDGDLEVGRPKCGPWLCCLLCLGCGGPTLPLWSCSVLPYRVQRGRTLTWERGVPSLGSCKREHAYHLRGLMGLGTKVPRALFPAPTQSRVRGGENMVAGYGVCMGVGPRGRALADTPGPQGSRGLQRWLWGGPGSPRLSSRLNSGLGPLVAPWGSLFPGSEFSGCLWLMILSVVSEACFPVSEGFL